MMRSTSCFQSAVVAILGLTWPASAAEHGTLTKRDLTREPIQFLGYSDGQLRYFGEDKNLTSIDVTEAVRVELGARGEAAAKPSPLLRLNDGQVVRGKFAGAAGGEAVRWESEAWGVIEAKLDDVASFQVDETEASKAAVDKPLAAAEESDSVLLANGDRLSGFIEALDVKGLRLNRDGQAVDLAWDTVATVTLANPIRGKPGNWVTTVAGDRVRVEGLDITGGRAAGKAFGKAVEVPFANLRAIDFAEHHRLVPLADVPHKVISGGTVFGVEHPPVFGAEGVALHAPITMRFDLPEHSKRFAATASLDRDSLQWADLVLIISDGKGELFKQRLNEQAPEAAINVETRDRVLTIQLDEGVQGPIRDRLRLIDAHVLVEIPHARP